MEWKKTRCGLATVHPRRGAARVTLPLRGDCHWEMWLGSLLGVCFLIPHLSDPPPGSCHGDWLSPEPAPSGKRPSELREKKKTYKQVFCFLFKVCGNCSDKKQGLWTKWILTLEMGGCLLKHLNSCNFNCICAQKHIDTGVYTDRYKQYWNYNFKKIFWIFMAFSG